MPVDGTAPEPIHARDRRSAVQRCSKIILEIIMRRAERAWKGLGKSTVVRGAVSARLKIILLMVHQALFIGPR